MSFYKADPNNSNKQIPNVTKQGISRYSHATCPVHSTITKRPSYVICNKEGTYAFAYESGSVSTYRTGSVVEAAAGGIRLDISPVAWRQVDAGNAGGTVGDVTFVYVRVS
jgi:hypothetical protein